MRNQRALFVGGLLFAMALSAGTARAEKPPKIPVAMGSWKGPHANTFKSAVRRGVGKDCVVVRPNKARVIIDGAVEEKDKRFSVRVIVKSPKNDEIIESKEYMFSKPTASQAQSNKMGRDVTEIARRTPE